MLLTIRQTGPGSEDLPSLLHHSHKTYHHVEFPLGKVRVFFPEFTSDLVEVALLVEADPLSRANHELPFIASGHSIAQYVNPRPYISSAMTSLALEAAFPQALEGTCNELPEAVETARNLEINLTSVPFQGNEEELRGILEVSGFEIDIESVSHAAAGDFPLTSHWDQPVSAHVRLSGSSTLSHALRRIHLILALLDDEKDFWLGAEEVNELWIKTQKWLSPEESEDLHPKFFAQRLKVYNPILKRLGDFEDPSEKSNAARIVEQQVEEQIGLQKAREKALYEAIKRSGARKVLDLNANSSDFLEKLIRDGQFTAVAATCVEYASLQTAANQLSNVELSQEEVAKIQLFPGSPLYRDERTTGYDAVVLAEWIEHLPLNRLPSLEMSVFRYMKPQLDLVTTPNAEYNPLLENLPLGDKRNAMHQFEWNRAEFNIWAKKVAEQYGYRLRMVPIGEKNAKLGSPCQMAHFTKIES